MAATTPPAQPVDIVAGYDEAARISGTIHAELLAELRELTVSVEPPETVLHGSLPDQCAVVGLGLRLIEVRRPPLGKLADTDADTGC